MVTFPLDRSEPRPTVLPNNNSGIQAIMTRSGTILLAFNNLKVCEDKGPSTQCAAIELPFSQTKELVTYNISIL